MKYMSEQSFWRSIERVLKSMRDERFSRDGCDDQVHWQRFEDKFGHGIPDLNICVDGREVWIELKQLDRLPVRDTTRVRVGLRSDQALWLRRRIKSGGRAFVVAKIGREIYIFNRYFNDLVTGIRCKDFHHYALCITDNTRAAIEEVLHETN